MERHNRADDDNKVKPVGETQQQSDISQVKTDECRIAAYTIDTRCHQPRVIVPGNVLFLTNIVS